MAKIYVGTIAAHLRAHDAKVERKRKQLAYRQERNSRRGLAAFVARLKKEEGLPRA